MAFNPSTAKIKLGKFNPTKAKIKPEETTAPVREEGGSLLDTMVSQGANTALSLVRDNPAVKLLSQVATGKTSDNPAIQKGDSLLNQLLQGATGKPLTVTDLRSEVLSPVASGASTAAFGLPKSALSTISPNAAKKVFPPQRTAVGKGVRVASELRGFSKGGALALGKNVASKIGGNSLLKAVMRGGAEGAVAGFVQSPADTLLGLKQRGLQAGVGSILGGLIEGGVHSSQKISQGFNSLKLGRESKKLKRKLRYEVEDVRATGKSAKETINIKTDRALDNINSNVQKLENSFATDLTKSTEDASRNIQPKLKKFFGEVSKTYGSARKDIIKNKNIDFNRRDAVRIVNESIDESINNNFIDSKSLERIQLLRAKYDNGILMKATGKRSPSQKIDMEEFLDDIATLKSHISSSAKKGTSGLAPDDIPIVILNGKVNNFLASKMPEMTKLNVSYGKFIDARTKANAIFKPYKGEFDTKAGTSFIKKAATEGVEAGEQRAFDVLKKGVTLVNKGSKVKGIGEVDKVAKDIASKYTKEIQRQSSRGVKVKGINKKMLLNNTRKVTKAIRDRKLTIRELDDILTNTTSAKEFFKNIGVGASFLATAGGIGAYGNHILRATRRN